MADTRTDPLVYEKVLLRDAPPCRFYAGVPLIQHDGLALGTLYVTDVAPRSISDRQVAALVTLSRQIMVQFAWRQHNRTRGRSGDEALSSEPLDNDSWPATVHPHGDDVPPQHLLSRVKALYDLGQQLLRAPSLEAMAQHAAERITAILPCSWMSIRVHDPDSAAMRTLVSTRPALGGPRPQQATASGSLDMPISGVERPIGVLSLETDQRDDFSAVDVATAQMIAAVLAVAIEHIQLLHHVKAGRDRLAVLSRRLIAVQEDERRHLARELHDEIGQALTAIRINLQHVYAALPTPADKAYAQDSIAIVHQLVQQVRTLSLDLRPSMLDDLGLISAVRWYLVRQERRSGLLIDFIAADVPIDLDPTIATACFRIVQEALTNILRHAGAMTVTVALDIADAAIHLSIKDDGRGFDPAILRRATTGEGLGLLGMQERAVLVGGTCTIQTTAGKGTQVRAHFPLGTLPLDRRQTVRADRDILGE